MSGVTGPGEKKGVIPLHLGAYPERCFCCGLSSLPFNSALCPVRPRARWTSHDPLQEAPIHLHAMDELARIRLACRDVAAQPFAEVWVSRGAAGVQHRLANRSFALLGPTKQDRVLRMSRPRLRLSLHTGASLDDRTLREIADLRRSVMRFKLRESFGALEALWQSYTAADPELGAVMARIAEDEARHASLAFVIDTWLQGLITPAQRRELRSAQRDACRALCALRAALSQKGRAAVYGIVFEIGKDRLRPAESEPVLRQILELLQGDPQLKLEIQVPQRRQLPQHLRPPPDAAPCRGDHALGDRSRHRARAAGRQRLRRREAGGVQSHPRGPRPQPARRAGQAAVTDGPRQGRAVSCGTLHPAASGPPAGLSCPCLRCPPDRSTRRPAPVAQGAFPAGASWEPDQGTTVMVPLIPSATCRLQKYE